MSNKYKIVSNSSSKPKRTVTEYASIAPVASSYNHSLGNNQGYDGSGLTSLEEREDPGGLGNLYLETEQDHAATSEGSKPKPSNIDDLTQAVEDSFLRDDVVLFRKLNMDVG
jgi:hypothetical protein